MVCSSNVFDNNLAYSLRINGYHKRAPPHLDPFHHLDKIFCLQINEKVKFLVEKLVSMLALLSLTVHVDNVSMTRCGEILPLCAKYQS